MPLVTTSCCTNHRRDPSGVRCPSQLPGMTDVTASAPPLREAARALSPDLADLRHAFHAEPEVGLVLPRTQRRILESLADLPLEISTGTRTTSVTAVLRGGAPGAAEGPVVLLRGDMDALPVQEDSGEHFASRIPGAMHACGHDVHTTMLVGAAHLLARHRDRLGGDVVLMFQPGEEGCDGAAVMLEEGVLDAAGRRVDAAFALHVFSALVPREASSPARVPCCPRRTPCSSRCAAREATGRRRTAPRTR
jgi:metal-dependent amidase/aminoacylase/carboxypeptidase family protein